jgi:hypothetical protein
LEVAVLKKIPVWKNVILIVSLLVTIIIATFAWFYTGTKADVEDFTIHVGKACYVQVSGDNGNNWSEDLDVEIGINKKFKELSGDGSTFFAPVYDVVENTTGGFSPELISFNKVNENEFYYEQIFDFRADTVQNVYLAPESFVTVSDNQGNSFIDGAIRVAFFELDGNDNESLKYIWAPNSTVEYVAETNSFTRDGNVEAFYYYQKSLNPVDVGSLEETTSDIAKISTEGTDESGCGFNQEYKFLWSSGQNLPENVPPVLTVNASGDDNHVYKRLKVKVWLEGYDRECVSLLNGQKFTVSLQFNAQEVE